MSGNARDHVLADREKMGIKQNYLYRVLPGLAEDGLLAKDGRGWRAKKPPDAPPAS